MSKPNGQQLTCTCGKIFYRAAAYLSKYKSRSCSKECYTGDPKERFLAMVDKNGGIDPNKPELGPCWLWKGYIDTKPGHGYGRFRFRGSPRVAHWVSYVLFVAEIPKGLFALHRCVGRRWCVNPSHIYAGTQKQNLQDQIDQGTFHRRNGEKVNTATLKEDQIPEIFKMKQKGIPQVEIAKVFHVSPQQICRILKGRSWKHLAISVDAYSPQV